MATAPEAVTSTLSAAPPDRSSRGVEQILIELEAALFADNALDMNEMKALRGFMERVAMRAQATGGIGQGIPQGGASAAPPPSAMEMNQNTSDYGSMPGTEPEGDEGA